MIEEHVNKIADIELAISVKTASMNRATTGIDARIDDAEQPESMHESMMQSTHWKH